MSKENNKDPFGAILDLSPLPANEIVVVDAPNDETETHDMETARQNIHHLIQKGNVVLDDLINVAQQSQHPRAYEVTANMIKTLADINQSLIDLQEKKKKLSIKEPEAEKIVNNNLYVGSTNDLLELLKSKKDV